MQFVHLHGFWNLRLLFFFLGYAFAVTLQFFVNVKGLVSFNHGLESRWPLSVGGSLWCFYNCCVLFNPSFTRMFWVKYLTNGVVANPFSTIRFLWCCIYYLWVGLDNLYDGSNKNWNKDKNEKKKKKKKKHLGTSDFHRVKSCLKFKSK